MTARIISLCFLLVAAHPLFAVAPEGDLFSEAESRYLGKNYTAALEAYDSFLAAYPLSPRTADVQYRRAACLYRLGRYGEAVQLLSDIERKYRATRYFSYVPFWKGLSQFALGSYALSVESLNAFLAGPTDLEFTPQALVHKALALIALANEAGAMEALAALRAQFPSHRLFPYAVVLSGSLLQRQTRYGELLDLTERTDSSGFPPEWKSEMLLLRADALWETGRTADAIPLYRQLSSAGEEIALVAYRRLFAAAQQREDLQEMSDLTQAAESRFAGRTSLLSELWTRVGAESFRAGKRDAAESFLRRAWNVRQAQPVSEVVPLYLAEILLGRKDAAGARGILEQSVASGVPGTGAALIRLGDIALLSDDFSAAEGYYTRFRDAYPDSRRSAEAGSLIAYCAFRQGKLAESARQVDDLLARPTDEATRQQLLKLRIVLLKKEGRTAEAAAALREYSGAYPTDLQSRIELLKVLFVLAQNEAIVREADAARQQFPAMARENPYASLLVSYLRGLALIARKDYAGAIGDLAQIKAPAAEKAGLGVIVPYAQYYLGWAYVRTAAFDKAARIFDDLSTAYPGHELSSSFLYLAGWAHFSLGEFDRAAGFFSTLAGGGSATDVQQKSGYLYAKSLLNMKRLDEAARALLAIASSTPASPWADSALFDYAGLLSDTGQARQAAEAYKRLVDSFPVSPLREEALYRRGEPLFAAGLWTDARAAFDEYRRKFPKGRLVDAALYWGGQAASSAGEGIAAALLWEQLIAGYKDSPFRGSSMQKTAEVYAQGRDYAKSLDMYTRFITEYPDAARVGRADIRTEQIRYLALGQSDREAELSAAIAKETGAKKREATIELARLYIFSGDARSESGYRALLPVIKEGEPESSAQSLYLVGEYFYRKGDLPEAARQFLGAAAATKANPALAAQSIYRAAEMMQLANRPDDVAALAARLSDAFPSSEWTLRARHLVEASR